MAVMIPALTGTIGFWSTLSLNMPDFTRFGRSQREQTIGQVVALPSTMTVFAAMGIAITSATALIYGDSIWDPIELGGKFESRAVVALAMFTVVVATLAVNIAANVVSPANDFANAFPRRINFKRGGLITGVIGVCMMPWQLLANPGRYLGGWLVGYSGALGAVGGVLVIDYWVIRRRAARPAVALRARGCVPLPQWVEPGGGVRHARRHAARGARRVLGADAADLQLVVVRRVRGGRRSVLDADAPTAPLRPTARKLAPRCGVRPPIAIDRSRIFARFARRSRGTPRAAPVRRGSHRHRGHVQPGGADR